MKDELKHFGKLGMKWGIRRAHPDRKVLRKVQGGEITSVRDKAKAWDRAADERDFKVAQKRGLIKKQEKKAYELSNAQLKNVLKSPLLKKDLAEIDRKAVRNAKILAGVALVGLMAIDIARINSMSGRG